MTSQQVNAHLFSLFAPGIFTSTWTVGSVVKLQNSDLLHRMIKVLRLDSGDRVVLFDQKQYVHVVIENVSKKDLTVFVEACAYITPLTPSVVFLLPLLKKDALEQAVYSLCEIGVTMIQLVVTQKSRQSLMSEKEFARLRSIVVAAAEQSKHYSMPELCAPKLLSDVILNVSKDFDKIVFDQSGQSFFKLREHFSNQGSCLLVGPEGGLTDSEFIFLDQYQFNRCLLTSTTLRAVQAVAVGAAIFRLQ